MDFIKRSEVDVIMLTYSTASPAKSKTFVIFILLPSSVFSLVTFSIVLELFTESNMELMRLFDAADGEVKDGFSSICFVSKVPLSNESNMDDIELICFLALTTGLAFTGSLAFLAKVPRPDPVEVGAFVFFGGPTSFRKSVNSLHTYQRESFIILEK